MATTGKQRSRRIDRNYTTAVDSSIVWKRRLGWAGLFLGLAYAAWLFFPSSAKQMSAGDLSKAHHAWNQTGCEKCHAPLSPIKPTSFGRNPHAIAENNQRCNACHKMTDHYPSAMQSTKLELESCVQCHHEHLGLNHNLLDIADNSCVRCHKNLNEYLADKTRKPPSITNFDHQTDGSGHPDFKGLATDPGTIAFSHIQHMRPGQPATPNDPTAKTFASLSPRFKQQYQNRQDANGLIQLTCGDCHVRDHSVDGYADMENYLSDAKTSSSGASQRNTLFQSSDHMLYKPVEFSEHCQACHELDVPHKLDLNDPDSLKDIIKAAQLQQLSRLSRNQNIPTTDQGILSEKSQQSASGKNLVDMLDSKDPQVGQAIMRTYGCNKCHQPPAADTSENFTSQIVRASGIKKQWLNDASFTHGKHLNVQCKICHPMDLASPAKPDQANAPHGGNASQVLIEGIATCRDCHISNESKRSVESERGRENLATANCIQCHKYHHGPTAQASPHATQSLAQKQTDRDPSGDQGTSP